MKLHDDSLALDHGAVRRELDLPCDRAAAWPLIADPSELATWLADEVDVEVRPGATGTVRHADGGVRDVVVEEVAVARRVVLRWWAREAGPEGATVVELTLDDLPGGGTRLAVVELPAVALVAVGTALVPPAGRPTGPTLLACR